MRQYLSGIFPIIPDISEIAVALGIFLLFILLRKFLAKQVFAYLLRLTSKTTSKLDNYFIMALERPLNFAIIALGIYLALSYLPLSAELDLFMSRIFRTILIVLVTLALYDLTEKYGLFAGEMEKRINIKIDKILIPFYSKVIKFIIVVLGLSVILQEWDYDINGLITGLGLGGLAFALAAQQTLSNIFGGIVIITDKPFSLGDWITTPSVEGTVEDLNFRSTKVRTFAQALVTVPNSTLANEPITNWSRMGKRRISFTLGVSYSTPREKLNSCIREIRNMLEGHDGVHPETIFVSFDSFQDSRFNIYFYFFTKTTKWAEYIKVKEDINFKIMEILEKEGVSIAFPSTSIYIEKQPERIRGH